MDMGSLRHTVYVRGIYEWMQRNVARLAIDAELARMKTLTEVLRRVRHTPQMPFPWQVQE